MTQKLFYSIFMKSIFRQPEDTFIEITLPKIDFYFVVFKQLENHILSYLTEAT